MKNSEGPILAPTLAGVLLAAGESVRLGQPKQLVKLDGESLVRRAAQLLLSVGVEPVVVTGHRSLDVIRELEDLPITTVFNPDWQQGMGSSIACGVQNIPGNVDGVLLFLCDQWRVEKKDLSKIISVWTTDISAICVASWCDTNGFVSGPPAIFPRKYIHELKFLKKDKGAKAVIDRHQHVSYLEMENAAYDLDRPEDLQQLVNRCV